MMTSIFRGYISFRAASIKHIKKRDVKELVVVIPAAVVEELSRRRYPCLRVQACRARACVYDHGVGGAGCGAMAWRAE
ncbi:MAG: hypothetical protein U9N09_00320 [Euryarchaeota archaeon]|nr:hypothetical protein [Euryarchaeota archaeon]